MDADRFMGSSRHLVQAKRLLAIPVHLACVLSVLMLGVCLPRLSMAEAPKRSAIPTQSATGFVAGTAVPQHSVPVNKSVVASAAVYGWQDGTSRRTLVAVPELEADFSPRLERREVLQAAGSAGTESRAWISPVFRDDRGGLRALPGGVIVTLRSPLDDASAQRLFDQAGITPSRRLTDTLWLIQAPTGLPALQLANRLADSGLFDSAQPNWWAPRIRK